MYITNLAYVDAVSSYFFFLSSLGRILVGPMYDKLNTILILFPSSIFIYCENMSDFPELVDLRARENEGILNILIQYLEVHNLSLPA